jgi:transposase
MSRLNCIAMDTHGKSTDICCKKSVKDVPRRWHVPTTIPALRAIIESIPRPRKLAFEEGPLADWLSRELSGSVEELTVSDPRRNGLIARDGDKDDAIDAEKLCDLMIGGYLRAVHHPQSLERSLFKRQVALYHERVEHRVGECNKVIGWLKGWGLIVSEKQFCSEPQQGALLKKLPEQPLMKLAKVQLQTLLASYHQAVAGQECMRRGLAALARKEELIKRLMELPGVGLIRAATFVAYVDTPWRFASKAALWKYLGIGLVREKSGDGREYLHVELACNRRLKAAIIGAAQSAIEQKENPFAALHQRWLAAGISPKNARRNVARTVAAVMWGMWKNGGGYEADRVGVSMSC